MSRTRFTKLADLRAFAAATPARLAGLTVLLAGKAYTTADLLSVIDARIAAATAVDAARSALKNALAAEAAAEEANDPVLTALREYVAVAFKGQPGPLADFGMDVKKPRTPLSAEKLALAVERSNATRKARGTLGKRQRLAIKGAVVGVTITPFPTVPPVLASTPEPAASVPLPAAGASATRGKPPA